MAEQFDDYNKLIVLRGGLDASEAQLLKSVLNAGGVEVFLNGENMASMNFAVRADVMVRLADKGRAEALLGKVAAMPHCQVPRHFDEDGEERACNHCGSTRVHPYVGEVPSIFPGVRFAAEHGGGWFHCLQCDSYYRDQRSRFAGLPVALLWSASLGGLGFGLYWFIDWIKWL